nr:MAG TPA: RecT protein [Siphoviridae sp. ct7Ev5]
MATTTGIELKKNNIVAQKEAKTVKGMLETPAFKKKFEEMLGKKAAGFISSIIAVTNSSNYLMKADPATVIGAAAQAAMLDLPINQSLGFAYIVPYKGAAQFQLGYKGYIQLAQRTDKYVDIGSATVYEGELETKNRLLGRFEFGKKTSDKVIGYLAYFKLKNGFEKYLFMTIDEAQKHAQKYSQNYKGGTDKWGLADFNVMAEKTVLKRLLSKFGPLSIEDVHMAQAVSNDGAVIRMNENGELDATFDGETIDAETETEESTDKPAENHDTYIVGGEVIDAETGEVIHDDK